MSRRGPDLPTRVAALDEVTELGAGRLPDEALERARGVVGRARERAALSPDYTVVALAGSTGSGKSSLLNALAGEEIAQAGITRPTTGFASAAVWAPRDDDSSSGRGRGRRGGSTSDAAAPGTVEVATDAGPLDGAGDLLDWLEVGSRRYLGTAGGSNGGRTSGATSGAAPGATTSGVATSGV